MIIEGNNLYLKSTEPDDPQLAGLVQDSGQLFMMSEKRLYPEKLPEEMAFRIEREGELIGEIRLKSLRWFNRKAELSLLITEKKQGYGAGKEALGLMIKYAFEKMNLHRLWAEIIEYNGASIQLFEKYGFQLEGKHREAKYSKGKYWDVLLYGLLKTECEISTIDEIIGAEEETGERN